MPRIGGMYLRHTTRRKDGKTHVYWRLVRSVRRGRKVRQETVAQLGELDAEGRARAQALARSITDEGDGRSQACLFDDDPSGMLPIDGRLDLHGLTAEQAQERVVEFLRTMRSRNERCVLVIHGKGDHSAGAGVLRGEIAAWLSQGRAHEHVLAFATARDDDGASVSEAS